jgi:cell division septum initiation protein DivIVA
MSETDNTTTTPFVSANSQAAARLLEMAANNADEIVAEAKVEAAELRAAAQKDADQVTSTATAEADQVLSTARTEAQRLTDEAGQLGARQTEELARARGAALADLENEKTQLGTQVDRLRELQRDHVARMRSYLTEELTHLDQLAQDTEAARPDSQD